MERLGLYYILNLFKLFRYHQHNPLVVVIHAQINKSIPSDFNYSPWLHFENLASIYLLNQMGL